ncbi:unnamed protein product [Chilo suppressalis]|uniref:FP protein C-terminal domain-containing protein n=1 Tax=Chilo suppressalis TaxID=168631 RepID=A0ABN8AZG5_CHISP|nr:unnamed protein product [Chilo suppressalis]
MPLRHSPPSASAPAQPLAQTHVSHAPATLDCESYSLSDNDASTQRQKRKRTSTTDAQLAGFMAEMRSLFFSFKEQQDNKLNKICSTIEEVKTQNNDIRASIEFLSSKYDSVLEQVNTLKEEVSQNQKYIAILEDKLERFERSSRSTCIEIKNIPVEKSETKASLLKTFTDIGSLLSTTVHSHEIKDIFRINSKNSEKKTTMIIELTSVIAKDAYLNAYKKYIKSHGNLTTENLKIPGSAVPIFISQNLTAKMKRLFYLAQVFANSNDFKYCWSTNGKIFIREKEGATLHWIKDENDLQKLVIQK